MNRQQRRAEKKQAKPIAPEASAGRQEVFAEAFRHHQAGRLTEAEGLYRQVLEADPGHADSLHLLGLIALGAGREDVAVDLISQAIAIDARFHFYHLNLGAALGAQGKLDEAVACYRRALVLKPDYADAHCNLGNALRSQGKLDEAVACCRRALALKPDFAEAHSNLGNALKDQGKLDEAATCYRRALALKPDYADAHSNLGNALQEQGKPDEAVPCYRQALALRPNLAEAYSNLGSALQELGKLDEATACYRQALVLKPDYADAHSNLLFCLNYAPDLSAEAIFAEYCRWDERHARPHRPLIARHGANRDPDRRLRIGYVSPDLRRHSVRHFIEPLLARHDKTKVEVFAYAQVAGEDEVSARLKGYTDHWRRTVGLSDAEMAERIGADGIDILVDLAGHTRGRRLPVFGRKPAPVQVSWLGYGYTTGLEAIDYFLADHTFAPAGCEPLFAEKLVRLPVFAAYRPAEGMGDPGPTREASAAITFGSLTRSVRINHRVVRAWAAILRGAPGSRLTINSLNYRSPAVRNDLMSQFAALGVSPERLSLGFDSPPWDVLRGFDISLDCFPHNSGTTLFESLYLGSPFITLAGRPTVGRLGSAILTAVGHPDWIATTEEEYVAKAVALAGDPGRLAETRSALRAEMEASPLMDEGAFARAVETAYRTMWRRWCSGEPAIPLDIPS